LCRCSAQKIATDSGKKLLKNNIKPKKLNDQQIKRQIPNNQKLPQGDRNSQNKTKTQKPQPKTASPYDPQNIYKEPQSAP
jgi:hypothetical protein